MQRKEHQGLKRRTIICRNDESPPENGEKDLLKKKKLGGKAGPNRI